MLGWEGSLSLLMGRDKFGDGLISGRDEDAMFQRNGYEDGEKNGGWRSAVVRVTKKAEEGRGWRCSSKKQKWMMACGWNS